MNRPYSATLLVFIITHILTNVTAEKQNYCVHAREGFECSSDPMATRNRVDGEHQMITRGIPQRIDGTEAEQAAIKKVLDRMDEYFLNEVLSKPEYAGVRSNCRNTNELCGFWAAIGECETNRVFMLTNCAAACRICLLKHTNIGSEKE